MSVASTPAYWTDAGEVAVTGYRQAEMVGGVQLSIVGGMLVALVHGAKVDVAGGNGQEWRRLEWPLNHPSALVQELVAAIVKAGGVLRATIANASNFSKSMSNAAAREWPKRKTTVTPYCFRHQLAADMKADGRLDSDAISAAVGHLSDATKSTYVHTNMCKGHSLARVRVTAARPVKVCIISKIKIKAAR